MNSDERLRNEAGAVLAGTGRAEAMAAEAGLFLLVGHIRAMQFIIDRLAADRWPTTPRPEPEEAPPPVEK